MTVIRTVCGQCSVGCGIRAVARDDEQVEIEGDRTHPANLGLLCAKGELLGRDRRLESRRLHPTIDGRPVGWNRAIAQVARRLSDTVARHGPQSVAMLLSGDLTTEDYFVANKIMKGFIGSANIDVAGGDESVAGAQRAAFGEDVTPPVREDIDEAALIFMIGAETPHLHPVLYRRILRARESNGTQLVVIAAAGTGADLEADLIVSVRPGSEARLIAGLLLGCHDGQGLDYPFMDQHVETPPGFWDTLRPGNDIWSVARDCELPLDTVRKLLAMLATSRRTMTLFQPPRDRDAAQAIAASVIDLHLATGQIGRPGTGPFALASGTNGMGAREVGCEAGPLTAHADFAADASGRVARFWAARRMAVAPGLSGDTLRQAMAEGRVRLVWEIGRSARDEPALREVAERVPLWISASPWATDPPHGIALPSASPVERDGTLTAADRLIGRQRRLFAAPADARPDWWTITRVAWALGWADAFAYERPADIYREHARLTAYAGDGNRLLNLRRRAPLSNPAYDEMTPWRWGGRAFEQGIFSTADGRARLLPIIT